MTDSTSEHKKRLQLALSILFALGVWQLAAMAVGQELLLPTPFAVGEQLFYVLRADGFLLTIAATFKNIAAGFFWALGLGFAFGILAASFPTFKLLFSPFAMTIKSVPVASFIVIFLIWFSASRLSTFISFLMVLPVIYNNILSGIESVDIELLECCEVFLIPWKRRIIYLWLPRLRPFLMSAASTGIGLAWKAGIAAEIIGIPAGSVGRMFYDAKIYLNTTELFAWTVIVVALSLGFEKIFLWILKVLFRRLEEL